MSRKLLVVDVLLGLILASFTCVAQSAHETATKVSAGPRFDVSAALGDQSAHKAIVQGAASCGGHLFILLSAGATTRSSTLVRTDLYGLVEAKTILGADEVTGFGVDDSCSAFIRALPPPPAKEETIRILDLQGHWTPNPSRTAGPGEIALIGNSLVTVSAQGTVARSQSLDRGPVRFVVPPLRRVDMALGLTGSELAVVDRVTPDIQLIDTDHQSARRIPLQLPEIEEARRLYDGYSVPAGTLALLIQTVARDEVGRLYVMFSGFNRTQGIPVVVFGLQGRVLARLRLETSLLSTGKWTVPAAMMVAAGQLYVVDTRGEITMYPLPETALGRQ